MNLAVGLPGSNAQSLPTPVPLGSGKAGQTATTGFSKQQTFLTLLPTFSLVQFLSLFPCNLAPPPLPPTLASPDPLPCRLGLASRTGPTTTFRTGPRERDSPAAEAHSHVALGVNSFFPSKSPECFSHKLHSSLQNNMSTIIL